LSTDHLSSNNLLNAQQSAYYKHYCNETTPLYTGWCKKDVSNFRMASCNRVIKINKVKSTYLVSKHLRISLKKLCLKHLCISRNTNEIVLHVIKQWLQAVHHSCRRLYAGYAKSSQYSWVSWLPENVL